MKQKNTKLFLIRLCYDTWTGESEARVLDSEPTRKFLDDLAPDYTPSSFWEDDDDDRRDDFDYGYDDDDEDVWF